jgi:hypothetical protein
MPTYTFNRFGSDFEVISTPAAGELLELRFYCARKIGRYKSRELRCRTTAPSMREGLKYFFLGIDDVEAAELEQQLRTSTFCVMIDATRGGATERFIYATFETYNGASLCAADMRERGAVLRAGGKYHRVASVHIVLLETPEFRAAAYNMTELERALALELPAVEVHHDPIARGAVYVQNPAR